MRPVLITLSLLLLVATALASGVLAADWPFWQRAWRWHAAAPAAPERLPGAQAWIPASDAPRELPLSLQPEVTTAVSPLLDDAATEALLVARNDELLFEYYGDRTNADLRMEGHELSMLPLVLLYGAAAAHAVGPTLDQSLAQPLQEWREDPRGEITPRLLLQGLSGLEAASGTPLNPFGRSARLMSGPNFARAALGFRTAWPAGSHYAPNPADAQLAALALVRSTDQPLAALMHEWLVQPLGLGSIHVVLDRHRGAMAAHCCIRARARDWLTLGSVVAQAGEAAGRRILPESFVREMALSSPVAPERGLGMEKVLLPGGGEALLLSGRQRLLLADPDSRAVWLWVGRTDFGPDHRARLLAAAAQGR